MSRFLRSISWAMLSILLCALGCSKTDEPSDEAPIPTAPALTNSSSDDDSATSGLPPGHPPMNSTASGSSQTGSGRVGPFEFAFRGLVFSVPKGWKEVELTAMQKGFVDARFLIPSGDAELQLTFSSVGGGVDANIQRWIGQFQRAEGEEPKIETLDVDGLKATWADIRGTFTGAGGPMAATGASQNQRMLGAALPLPTGDVYLKLTGPRDQVAGVHDDVRSFVSSAKQKN